MRLIDADEVIKDIKNNEIIKSAMHDIPIAKEIVEGFCNILSNAPTVDAEQHGKWIMKETYNEIIDKYVPWIECSECGYAPYFTGIDEQKYCPYCRAKCGAKMDKE